MAQWQTLSDRINTVAPSATLAVDSKAKAMKAAGLDVVGFGAGEPNFPTPANVVKAAADACLDPKNYKYTPTPGLPELREAIAAKMLRDSGYEVNADQVVVTNGGKQAVYESFQILLNDGDEVIIPAPYWTSYPEAVKLAGGVPVEVFAGADVNFEPSLEALEAARTEHTKAIIVNSPNNPTGAVWKPETVEAIGRWAVEHHIWVISDEIYEHLNYDDAHTTYIGAAVPECRGQLLVLNGVAKTYAMPGWRVGWMVLSGNKRLAKDYIEGLNMLANMRMCSNVPAQSVVQTALGGHQSVKDYLVPGGRIYDQRELVYNMLNDIPGITAVKPKAAFYIFPKIDVKKFNIHSDEQFALDLLHDKHILISHGGAFNWQEPDHFRVVYLPRISMLKETIGEIGDFFSTYWQA